MQLEEYFTDALLVELSKQIIRSSTYFSTEEFGERIAAATDPRIPDTILDNVLSELVEQGFTSEIQDDVGGSFTKLNYTAVNKFVSQQLADPSNFIFRYSQVGQPLLARIVERLGNVEIQEGSDIPTTTDPFESVPASDRIVRRSDNEPLVLEIRNDIEEIRKALREDNEIGADLGDEREIVDLELEIADTVLQRPRFRLKSLLNWLLPALSFLAEKFASGAIGEAAKQLVDLLLKLI